MPVDPSIAPFLQMVNATPSPETKPEPEEVRAGLRNMALLVAPQPPLPLWSVQDSVVPGPIGDIPIRVYRATDAPAPTVAYFHGGGWLAGDLDSHDFLLRKLAHETGFVYVAVHYRRPPESPFPAAVDDSSAAAEWIASHLDQFGGTTQNFAVAGDSAGGNLAAVVARRMRDRGYQLAAQLLLYPVIDPGGDYPSRIENSHGYLLTTADAAEHANVYLGDDTAQLTSPDLAPIRASNLTNLAPAVIGVAEFDPLRDEALAYADALTKAGVKVYARSYNGMVHTFAALYNVSEPANAALVDLLRQFTTFVNH